jgi:hypothetical protein
MRRFALVLLLLVCGADSRAAGASLDDSWWAADRCFITDLIFLNDHRVNLLFDDGKEDSGTWSLTGSTFTIKLERFADDTFTGRFIGNRFLRATHRWKEDRRAPLESEECEYERMFAPQT